MKILASLPGRDLQLSCSHSRCARGCLSTSYQHGTRQREEDRRRRELRELPFWMASAERIVMTWIVHAAAHRKSQLLFDTRDAAVVHLCIHVLPEDKHSSTLNTRVHLPAMRRLTLCKMSGSAAAAAAAMQMCGASKREANQHANKRWHFFSAAHRQKTPDFAQSGKIPPDVHSDLRTPCRSWAASLFNMLWNNTGRRSHVPTPLSRPRTYRTKNKKS